ncbi:hypothetical protein ACOME3_009286 [Neoechinorhynchus agilis]
MMEAHNGISAKIVEETGFKSIWASGLCISAQWAVRDANEASWTQVLNHVEFMADATNIPIMLDADTGFGNFNNARRLVTQLEKIGVAGACIEDKFFPKKNSFVDGRSQPLADPNEFCLKIKAMKDTQKDPHFCIVARIEAFIAGWGVEEALQRADAYVSAGADAILVHSKATNACEIEAFMSRWQNQAPIVIVPTKYYKINTEVFRNMGISLIIWANHNLRASVTAMQTCSKEIFDSHSVAGLENQIASVQDIFHLQNQRELLQAEEKYLPPYCDIGIRKSSQTDP